MEIKAYVSDGLFMFYLRGIFGVSSGYLRDKAKGKFMYQKNDRFYVP